MGESIESECLDQRKRAWCCEFVACVEVDGNGHSFNLYRHLHMCDTAEEGSGILSQEERIDVEDVSTSSKHSRSRY